MAEQKPSIGVAEPARPYVRVFRSDVDRDDVLRADRVELNAAGVLRLYVGDELVGGYKADQWSRFHRCPLSGAASMRFGTVEDRYRAGSVVVPADEARTAFRDE